MSAGDHVDIHDQRAHGAVAAVLEAARASGLTQAIRPHRNKKRGRVMAMVVWHLLHPDSRCGVVTELGNTGTTTLGAMLEVGASTADHLSEAMDWLIENQDGIERCLAQRHLADERSGTFYALNPSHFGDGEFPPAQPDHSRDRCPDRPQVTYGLLCAPSGYPVAIEALASSGTGATALESQVRQIGARFGLPKVALVDDRGMVCNVSVESHLRAAMKWVSALRSTSITEVIEQDTRELDLFTERGLAHLTSPDFPGERLEVCHNPWEADWCAAKRDDFLRRTEARLDDMAKQYETGTITRKQLNKKIRATRRWKMIKYINYRFDDNGRLHRSRNEERIREESKLDGFHIIRTTVDENDPVSKDAMRAHRNLARVKHAFRHIRDTPGGPLSHHWSEERVRAHLLLSMLAYHIEHHLHETLEPLLPTDETPTASGTSAKPAGRSASVERKVGTPRRKEVLGVGNLRELLDSLGNVCVGKVYPSRKTDLFVPATTVPNAVQAKAFELLGFDPLSDKLVACAIGGKRGV